MSIKIVIKLQDHILPIKYLNRIVGISLFLLLTIVIINNTRAQVNAGQDVVISAGLPVNLTSTYTGYTANRVTAQDDYFVGPFDIGFEFTYFGDTYTQFAIGPNGLVSFDLPDILDVVYWSQSTIPNNTFKKTIMGPYQDLFDRPIAPHSSYIYYVTIGEEPDRKLVVGWCEAPMYNCTDNRVTYQIVLHEADSSIENHIFSKPACELNLGNKATHGLNLDDIVGVVVPGRNNTSWTASNETWRFTPDGPGNYIITQIEFSPEAAAPPGKASWSWYELTYPGGNQISSGQTVTVSPTETTSYFAEVELCGGLRYYDEVVISTIPIPNAFNPNSPSEENRIFKVYADPEGLVKNYAMYIYNRWGQLIFESRDINKGWNGRFNGSLCDAGVYVWTIYYDGDEGKATHKGIVTLVK